MTSTALVAPFDFDGQVVRAAVDDDGAPWIVAADVARALGHRDTEKMTRSLDADEMGTRLVGTPGGPQEMTVLTEAGVYAAILTRQTGRITNPEAREAVVRFKRWVTHEVLPTLRRTGSYSTATTTPDVTSPDQLLAYLEAGALAARQLVAARQEIDALTPRALVADTLLNADGDQSVADTAKELASRAGVDIGRDRLFDLLEDLGWIYKEKGDGRWHAYQRSVARGLVAVKPQTRVHPETGERIVAAPQVRVTPKGLQRLVEHLKPSAALAVAS